MSIRLIKTDEKFSPSVTVNGKKSFAKYAVRKNENAGERYELSTVFDFTGVTEAELIEMATKGLVVDTQRVWRVAVASKEGSADALKGKGFEDIGVRKLLDSPRARSSAPATVKAKKLIDGMSAAEKAELLALLGVKQEEKK